MLPARLTVVHLFNQFPKKYGLGDEQDTSNYLNRIQMLKFLSYDIIPFLSNLLLHSKPAKLFNPLNF